MGTQTMWVDSDRCTGCGECVEVCPTEAMAMVDGKARVDEETCIGCGDCADECPEDAIQPVVQGELVPAPQRPAPTVYRPGPGVVEMVRRAKESIGGRTPPPRVGGAGE